MSGRSQSLEELREDMRWWFTASDHLAKIVLLASLALVEGRPRVVVEKWIEKGPERTGATGTRNMVVEPVCDQRIEISRASADPNSGEATGFDFTGLPLRLELSLVLLRPPGPGERNFIFGDEELNYYARVLWARMGLF
jgi:hypothetical protein